MGGNKIREEGRVGGWSEAIILQGGRVTRWVVRWGKIKIREEEREGNIRGVGNKGRRVEERGGE